MFEIWAQCFPFLLLLMTIFPRYFLNFFNIQIHMQFKVNPTFKNRRCIIIGKQKANIIHYIIKKKRMMHEAKKYIIHENCLHYNLKKLEGFFES